MKGFMKSLSAAVLVCFAGFGAHAGEIRPPGSMDMETVQTGLTKAAPMEQESIESDDDGYPWRGLLIGADHGSGDIHHDNVFIQINDGPIIYQTTIPARQEGSLLTDPGLLWHFFSRDDTLITVYATSAYTNGLESDLSDPFPLYFSYPQPAGCSAQTVPVAVAGPDQVVAVGTAVTLDGSLSYDEYEPDSLDLVYRWECYSAPESGVVLSDDGKSAAVSFTPTTPGQYYFRLAVKDKSEGENFNSSPIDYVRVSAVDDTQPYLIANAGRTRQARVGDLVILDGSQSQGSSAITSFFWTMENPLNSGDIENMAGLLGSDQCQGNCHLSNFNADSCVDGQDLAILADNYSGISLPGQAVVQFQAGIARPHIFKLTVSDGSLTESETTIVAVNHPNADPVLTSPPVDSSCLE